MRQRQCMATPNKQLPAQPLLQLPDLVADRRLRHAEFGGRTRETQKTRSRFKCPHCTQGR